MSDLRDLWIDEEVVWAVPSAPLQAERHRDLTQRALALAAESRRGCILFDYRHTRLMHDVLARHALWLVRSELEVKLRAALLVRDLTPDSEFWSRLLWLSGVAAAVFTDVPDALQWFRGSRA
jgi:hypothetical protein